MNNDLLIAATEQVRNDERYRAWLAKGAPRRRREQIAIERAAYWAAVTGEAERLAELEHRRTAAALCV
jgi:hypothetical protein